MKIFIILLVTVIVVSCASSQSYEQRRPSSLTEEGMTSHETTTSDTPITDNSMIEKMDKSTLVSAWMDAVKLKIPKKRLSQPKVQSALSQLEAKLNKLSRDKTVLKNVSSKVAGPDDPSNNYLCFRGTAELMIFAGPQGSAGVCYGFTKKDVVILTEKFLPLPLEPGLGGGASAGVFYMRSNAKVIKGEYSCAGATVVAYVGGSGYRCTKGNESSPDVLNIFGLQAGGEVVAKSSRLVVD